MFTQSTKTKHNTLGWKHGELRIPQTRYNFRSRTPESFKSRAVKHLLAQHIYAKHYAHHILMTTVESLKWMIY